MARPIAAVAVAWLAVATIGCGGDEERGVPEDVVRHNTLGTAYLGQQQWPEAEAEFRRALALRPDDPLLLDNTAVALIQQGRTADAAELLEQALAADADFPWAHFNLGLALDSQGKPVEENGVPVVRPPVGGDAYILARLWEFWPILEFKRGESYRIHLSSTDWQHGFSLQPTNINISVHPGYEHVITLTPTGNGDFGIICNEFCGIGHHTMTGRIRVVE